MSSLYPTVLIVDDEQNTRDGLKKFFESSDYDVLTASNGKEGWELYQSEKPDLILSDIRMPDMDGVALLDKILGHNPKALVILLTAYGTVEDAVKSMKKGAFYYLTKPVNLEELEFLVRKAFSRQNLERENIELKEELFKHKFDTGNIVAYSSEMKEVLQTVEQIAKSNSTALIEGESGTGKELIAHRIHELSNRKDKPFVAVHCAALTDSLLTSEIFGHEKGAFTGATERKIGRFERAHGGTLFLDEIGEISQETQVKLLRVLQDGAFERVGGTKTIKVDVRLVCATNKNLAEEVKEGRFREDLYYRINVIYLKMPPLRERKADIPHLVQDFLKEFSKANGKKISGITKDAEKSLSNYSWPGNIRELKNIIERMVVLSSDSELNLSNVPEDLKEGALRPSPRASEPLQSSNLTDMEKSVIEQTLKDVRGNKSVAAKKLGISRRTLYRKLDEYGLK